MQANSNGLTVHHDLERLPKQCRSRESTLNVIGNVLETSLAQGIPSIAANGLQNTAFHNRPAANTHSKPRNTCM